MSELTDGSREMTALVVTGPGRHGLERIPVPVPGPGEALVEVSHVAICGTDLKLLRGQLHDADYPVIPGHEWAGRVVTAPSRPELVGRTVVGDGITPCGSCENCGYDRPNLCTSLDEVGFTRPGAFASAFCIPAANLRPLPETLSGAEGCLLEPLCVALHAIERAPEVTGRSVGVLGGGTIGLLVGQLAVHSGAKSVTIAEPLDPRRDLAAELGLTTVPALTGWSGAPPEIVFDATGSAAVFPEGVAATRPGGAYVLVGYSGDATTAFQPSAIMLSEIAIYGVLSGYAQLDRAIDLVLRGAVRLAPLVGETLPMTDYRTVLSDRGSAAPLRTVFTAV
jgi:2-desacetyl-2-hydroxyethyl bacteriochlorophyllide A dehydrogenase